MGLALALEIATESGEHDDDDSDTALVRSELLLYTAGIVVMTLVINGLGVTPLYR